MAEKKEHKIISASTGETTTRRPGVAESQIAKSTVGLRIGSIVLWVIALVAEFLAIKGFLTPADAKFMGMAPLTAGIVFLVIDLITVICGSLLWKKANHIHPASEKQPVKFWLWNNLGVIMAVIAFLPVIIILLTNKNIDKRTKTIGTIVGVVALLIAGVSSYDFNPYSQEEQQDMLELEQSEQNVYWTEKGGVYHIYEDCQHLDRTETLYNGTAEEAEAAGKERLCKTCQKRFEAERAAKAENAENVLEEVADAVLDETATDEVTE